MPRKPHTRHRRKRTFLYLALLALLLALYVHWENRTLQVSHFDVSFADLPAGFDGCRIAVLADLHSAEFGDENQDLFAAVSGEHPEYIFFLGDLEDRFEGRREGYAQTVAASLSAIAPTYYVTGNHEWAIGGVRELKKELAAEGVTVLSNQYVTLTRNGDPIVLAGIDDPRDLCRGGGYFLDAPGSPEQPLPRAVQPPGGGSCSLRSRSRRHLAPALYRRPDEPRLPALPLLHRRILSGKRLFALCIPGPWQCRPQLPRRKPPGDRDFDPSHQNWLRILYERIFRRTI